jgi:hypothetical protein
MNATESNLNRGDGRTVEDANDADDDGDVDEDQALGLCGTKWRTK